MNFKISLDDYHYFIPINIIFKRLTVILKILKIFFYNTTLYSLFQEQQSTVFVAIPRIQDGVPLTLGYVTREVSIDGNPLIAPYPNWSYNDVKYCDGLTSVYRMQVSFFFSIFLLNV